MSKQYALDKMILEKKKLSDLTPEELVELIHDDRLTAEMFMEVQREYLSRLRKEEE